jgi:hypothetical protein
MENGFQIGLRAEQTISKANSLASIKYRKEIIRCTSTGLTYNPNQTMLG